MEYSQESLWARTAIERAIAAHKVPPKIIDYSFEFRQNIAGADSIFVRILLATDTRDEDWTTDKLEPIRDAIRTSLTANRVDRWVYVSYDRAEPSQRAAG